MLPEEHLTSDVQDLYLHEVAQSHEEQPPMTFLRSKVARKLRLSTELEERSG